MRNNSGFIKLSRKFFTSTLWEEKRTFSNSEAWLDLIQSARYQTAPQKARMAQIEVICHRGQYVASLRHLSEKWGWTLKKVRSFLDRLKKQQMITVESSHGTNIITLCNYEEYNPKGTVQGTPKGTVQGIVETLNANELDNPEGTVQGTPKGTPKGTNTKNNKNINKKTSSTNVDESKTPPPTEDFLSQITDDAEWRKSIAAAFKIYGDTIDEYLEAFRLHCQVSAKRHTDPTDAKSHFASWLQIQLRKSDEQRQSDKRAQAAKQEEQRQHDAAQSLREENERIHQEQQQKREAAHKARQALFSGKSPLELYQETLRLAKAGDPEAQSQLPQHLWRDPPNP